jgi:hypothetical protein
MSIIFFFLCLALLWHTIAPCIPFDCHIATTCDPNVATTSWTLGTMCILVYVPRHHVRPHCSASQLSISVLFIPLSLIFFCLILLQVMPHQVVPHHCDTAPTHSPARLTRHHDACPCLATTTPPRHRGAQLCCTSSQQHITNECAIDTPGTSLALYTALSHF